MVLFSSDSEASIRANAALTEAPPYTSEQVAAFVALARRVAAQNP